jgi:hypothetical protein
MVNIMHTALGSERRRLKRTLGQLSGSRVAGPSWPAHDREGLMRVGSFTMPLHPPGADLGRTMADDLGQLVFLDQLGFEEAWVGEHITAEWENIRMGRRGS